MFKRLPFLILFLLLTNPVLAQTPSGVRYQPRDIDAMPRVNIAVETVSQLIDALETANQDCEHHYLITLKSLNYPLREVVGTVYGDIGLPAVTCTVTINGEGAKIERVSETPFRIFTVVDNGYLRLNNLIVANGSATMTGGSGVLGVEAGVHLYRVRLLENVLDLKTTMQIIGAGVYVYYGELTIEESEIRDNANHTVDHNGFAMGDGGGVGVISSKLIIHDSILQDNTASKRGHAVVFLSGAGMESEIRYSCILGDVYSDSLLNAAENWWEGTPVGSVFIEPALEERPSGC